VRYDELEWEGVPTVDLETERSTSLGKGFRVLSNTPTRLVRFEDSLVPVETVEKEEAIDFVLLYRWASTFEHEGATYNKSFLQAPVPRGRVWVDLLDHLNVPERVSAVVACMGGLYQRRPTWCAYYTDGSVNEEDANRGWMFQEQLFGPDNLAGNKQAMEFWIAKYLLGGAVDRFQEPAAERYNVSTLRALARNRGYLQQCKSAALANAMKAAFTYDADRVAASTVILGAGARECCAMEVMRSTVRDLGSWTSGFNDEDDNNKTFGSAEWRRIGCCDACRAQEVVHTVLEGKGMLVGVACGCGRVVHAVDGAVDLETLSESSCTYCGAKTSEYRTAAVQFGGRGAGSVKMLVARFHDANLLDALKGCWAGGGGVGGRQSVCAGRRRTCGARDPVPILVQDERRGT